MFRGFYPLNLRRSSGPFWALWASTELLLRCHDPPVMLSGFERMVLTNPLYGEISRRVNGLAVPLWAGLPGRADVLELGCGAGYTTAEFAAKYPQWRITATDVDPDMVEIAAARLTEFVPRVRVEQADAISLEYHDASFDLVIALGVWHHIGAWDMATLEAGRVLRPGGKLVLTDALPMFFFGPVRLLFPPTSTYTLQELTEMLRKAECTDFNTLVVGNLFYRMVATKRAEAA